MNYFSLRGSLNPKIIGGSQQVQSIIWPTNTILGNEYKITNFPFKPAPETALIAKPVLSGKSKITDIIDISLLGFYADIFVSENLKNILIDFCDETFQLFESSIVQKDKQYEKYWIIHPTQAKNDLIDFSASEICIKEDYLSDDCTQLLVKDIIDFNKLLEKYQNTEKSIVVNRAEILNSINTEFFVLNHVSDLVSFVVSENLKRKIEDSAGLGVEFKPLNLTFNEWFGEYGERQKIY